MRDYKKIYGEWLTSPFIDDDSKRELSSLTDEREIEDRFYKDLEFGTGGLRGVIGAGANRMNVYTVGKVTQGLANFINSQSKNRSVVIAYDSRPSSKQFALHSALVLCENGIKCYLFENLRPTPELSYAVRELNATAGIVITASHNPPEFNGYKVYWGDGGQIVAPYDKLIADEVKKVQSLQVKRMEEAQAKDSGLLRIIGEQTDKKYIDAIKNLSLNPDLVKLNAKNLKIVYTPLNGTGFVPVTRILKELGYTQVYVVKEQALPDGNFSTLKSLNPESPTAYEYALKLAQEVSAELVLATDPDADRLGVYVRDDNGNYLPFTGNMSGLLIAEYVLSQKKLKGLLPKNPQNGALLTTVVSSKMGYAIGKEYGLTVIETLTGFKYVGEQINLFERAVNNNGGNLCAEKGAYEFVYGYEESYGCLVGSHVRDKDAVSAVSMLCEAAIYYKSLGLTLYNAMQNLYKKYGYYLEGQEFLTLKGAYGAQRIYEIVNSLRKSSPDKIGGRKVVAVRDYQTGIRTQIKSGKSSKMPLPNSNVLYFELENEGWCCVRPSGTEPKIKFYFGVKENNYSLAESNLNEIKNDLLRMSNF